MSSNAEWVDAMPASDLPEDDVIGVQAAGREFAIYQVGGEIFATDNLCTHGNARLCEGFLEDHMIECPLHQGQFDIRDGRPLCAPVTEPIRCYPVRVEDGRVQLQVSPPA